MSCRLMLVRQTLSSSNTSRLPTPARASASAAKLPTPPMPTDLPSANPKDSGAVATDGIFSQERSHPRAWGSAARILGRYVRDEKALTLEEAVRKMTSLPASRMGLADRGIVRPGMAADLVVFDPARVRDVSTYEDPLHYSEGIPYVAVNGQLVVDGGKITDARPGVVLRGPGYR